MKTVELAIKGMTCRGCAEKIRETLEKEAGVIDAKASLKQRRAVIQFNSGQTTGDRISNSEALTKNVQGQRKSRSNNHPPIQG